MEKYEETQIYQLLKDLKQNLDVLRASGNKKVDISWMEDKIELIGRAAYVLYSTK